ncbi:molybdenum-pterin-binding domain-containing protein [Brasilonema octagenarum UFV-OR1]|uniref:Molybdenum-pterin-binding domain-containing protein n=1 Tax=Brasilonema octagenarum UFV-OR1 TaxID=417115 RepID=A0ABX1MK81_9CYAN|nr:molybdenum-pterin-binding domain-containing protein [Brasilonema octagenarum UFV-OR1]
MEPYAQREQLLYTITLYNIMKKRLDFRVEEYELQILEDYCAAVGRTKTDVLRELIRTLKTKRKPLL